MFALLPTLTVSSEPASATGGLLPPPVTVTVARSLSSSVPSLTVRRIS